MSWESASKELRYVCYSWWTWKRIRICKILVLCIYKIHTVVEAFVARNSEEEEDIVHHGNNWMISSSSFTMKSNKCDMLYLRKAFDWHKVILRCFIVHFVYLLKLTDNLLIYSNDNSLIESPPVLQTNPSVRPGFWIHCMKYVLEHLAPTCFPHICTSFCTLTVYSRVEYAPVYDYMIYVLMFWNISVNTWHLLEVFVTYGLNEIENGLVVRFEKVITIHFVYIYIHTHTSNTFT